MTKNKKFNMTGLNLRNYNTEETPTESKKGGALLYIPSDINYKVWMHVKTLQNFNTRVQKYPDAHFRKHFQGNLGCISNGRFQHNLINYNSHNPTSQFLDGIYSNNFSSYINIPTHHTTRSKTLIDNIFHNENAISGNMTNDISDHLAQFLTT